MLDMLLPADSARKHAHTHGSHDSSTPDATSPSSLSLNGSFLMQMPLSIIGSVLRRQTPSPSPSSPHSPVTKAAHNGIGIGKGKPTDCDALSSTPPRPVSSGSTTTLDSLPKKRTRRSKTSYICARPPRPVDTRSKLYTRPKVILQLHQVIPSQRPKPTYEVVPFSLLPPRSTRQLARAFQCRDKLGSNDLLIVEAEAYESKEDDSRSDDDRWGSREVVGVICPAKSDKETTVIYMDAGGSQWEVTDMSNGGFEFNSIDELGRTLKARWVLKPGLSRRTSGMSLPSPASPTSPTVHEDSKYTFSTIRPTSRRHPIIATMTHSRIDVMDSYIMPSATSPPTPASLSNSQTPTLTPLSIDEDSFFSDACMPIATNETLRRFILVSGVWVASKGYGVSTASGHPVTSCLETSATFRTSNNRTLSMSLIDPPRSASPSSTGEENHRSFPRLLRSSRERLPRSTSFTAPSAPHFPVKSSQTASPVQKARSRRANSTGNTNMYNMTGSMRRRYGLAPENETLPESEEELQIKRSAEILRIKELALSPAMTRFSSETPTHGSIRPVIPLPIVTRPSSDIPPQNPSPLHFSPSIPESERTRKTQSAYNPITTAGMWDSGVTERPGLKSRPTSMFVINEKKKKEERKRERSKSKEGKKYEKERLKDEKEKLKDQKEKFKDEKDCSSVKKPGEWHKIKLSLKTLFRREKA